MIIMDGKDAMRLKRIFWAISKRIAQLRGEEPAHPVGCGCAECDRINLAMENIHDLGKD